MMSEKIPEKKTIKCPWCDTSYSGYLIFTSIVNVCKVCSGGYKLIGQKTIKVLERPPTEEIMVTEDDV